MNRLVNVILGMLVGASVDMFQAKGATTFTWVWNNFLRDLPMYLLVGAVGAELVALAYKYWKSKKTEI